MHLLRGFFLKCATHLVLLKLRENRFVLSQPREPEADFKVLRKVERDLLSSRKRRKE